MEAKKQEKPQQELTCTFSKLVITDGCVAYGTSTRKNNSNFYGPFYNLGVAIIWILYNFRTKSSREKKKRLGDLLANFQNLKGETISEKSLRVDEFVSADGVRKGQIISELVAEYKWLGLHNTTKAVFLANKAKSAPKPQVDPDVLHCYCIAPSAFDASKKVQECHYIAKQEEPAVALKGLSSYVLWVHRGTTYVIHHEDRDGPKNEAIELVFPAISEKYEFRGRVEVTGLKPLHRLDEEEKKAQKSGEFKMDKPKKIPLTLITAKPLEEVEKDTSLKRKRKHNADDFLRGIVNFTLGGDE